MRWAPLVHFVPDEGVRCGALPFRHGPQHHLTVIVKATFSLVHGGPMTPAPPAEIVAEDRHFDGDPRRSVEAPSDLAPFLGRCDVVFRGHVHAQKGRAAPAATARLALFRDARPLLDRTLHAYGDLDPRAAAQGGAAAFDPRAARRPFLRVPLVYERAFGGADHPLNPVGSLCPTLVDPADPRRPAAFGAIARRWPARRALLPPEEALGADGILDLPESVSWEAFQAAPAEQRIAPLRGGEWLVLDGLHPALPRLQTRFLPLAAEARVFGRGAPSPIETKVDLVADLIAIDGDAGLCSVVLRGRTPLGDLSAGPSTLVVAAGLARPDRAVPWAQLAARAAALLGDEAARSVRRPPTRALSVEETESGLRVSAVPFASAHARPSAAPGAPRTDATPWGPPSMRVPVTTAPAADAALGTIDETPEPSPTFTPGLTEPEPIGPLAGRAPEVAPAIPEAARVGLTAANEAPAPIAPPAPPALPKKPGRGGIGAEAAEAYLRSFELPPPPPRRSAS